MSRRKFVTLTVGSAVAASLAVKRGSAASAVTAQGIVERIKKSVSVEWKDQTADTFKAGDPSTVVTGVVTTSMATMDVLAQAVKAGANFVITAQPTFYSRSDSAAVPPPAPDAVFTGKSEFIRKNGLVIWRFSDHWRLRKPDPLTQGLADALGWSRFRNSADPARFTIPAIALSGLASDVKRKLNIRGGARIVGDPTQMVRRVGLLPGTTPIQAALKMLPEVDVIIAGEVREWESVEYARDKLTAGEPNALMTIGRVVSEDPGMNVCAQWLKTIVPEVRTTWISSGDPYWRPR